jgi:hypothetical protein
MAGNGGRTRGKGFVRLTRAGCSDTPRSNTRRPSWRNTPFPGSSVTVPLNIRRHPPSFNASPHLRPDIPIIRAGTISRQTPPAQYPYNLGRNHIIPTNSSPISLFFGPELYHSSHLRPNIPTIRAGTIPFQPPPAQYHYNTGRNHITPATSGPISLQYGPEQHSANQLRPPKELYPGRRKNN